MTPATSPSASPHTSPPHLPWCHPEGPSASCHPRLASPPHLTSPRASPSGSSYIPLPLLPQHHLALAPWASLSISSQVPHASPLTSPHKSPPRLPRRHLTRPPRGFLMVTLLIPAPPSPPASPLTSSPHRHLAHTPVSVSLGVSLLVRSVFPSLSPCSSPCVALSKASHVLPPTPPSASASPSSSLRPRPQPLPRPHCSCLPPAPLIGCSGSRP